MSRRAGRRRAPEEEPSRDPRLSLLSTRIYDGPQERPAPRKRRRAPDRRPGGPRETALFFSCHGGSGSTTLAVNTGALLARTGRTTCVVDLDLQFGDALTALNLRGGCFISDLLADRKRVEPGYLHAKLPRHDSGLYVVSQVGNVDGLGEITPRRFARLLKPLRRAFDVLIIDGVRDFSDYALATLDVADAVVMVATPELPTLKGLVMRLELYDRLSYDIERVQVVLNRSGRRSPAALEAVSRSLRVRPELFVSDDAKPVQRALHDGRPVVELAAGARVSRDLRRLAQRVFTVDLSPRRRSRRRPEQRPARRRHDRRGFFSRILGRPQ